MKKSILSILFLLLVNISSAQEYTIRVKLKETVEATQDNINLLTESQRANATFNNSSFTNTYPGASAAVLHRYYSIGSISDTATAKELLIGTDLFETVRVLGLSYALNQVCEASFPATNDPLQNGFNYALEMIGASCAWNLTKGNPNVLIGIADSDFDEGHEDLANKIYSLSGVITSQGQHGTKVAGVAAAHTNNGVGLASIGYNCMLALERMPHIINGTSTQVYEDDIKTAIMNLDAEGVKVINVSWSKTGLDIEAAEELTQNGTTLVLAAGNTPDANAHTSIANIPGVILVSGVNHMYSHGLTGYAHNEYVDICAPSKVMTLKENNEYVYTSGTSHAAPQVAGTIGLMLSVNPCLTPAEIEEILKSSAESNPIADADDFPGLVGAGILNSGLAVQMAIDYPGSVGQTDYLICEGEEITMGPNAGVGNSNYQWFFDGAIVHTGTPYTFTPNLSGTYTLISSNPDDCFDMQDYTVTIENNTCNCGEYFHHNSIVVEESQTWNTNTIPNNTLSYETAGVLRVENQLLVKSGATLTLSADVQIEFGHYGQVTIEKGAKLIVNGATLTKSCEDYWYGIEVFGDNSLSQAAGNQGELILNQARIEYAKNGVMLIGHDENYDKIWGTAGGVLKAENTTFYNCRRGVEFMKYQSYNIANNPVANKSYIKTSNFIVDESINATFKLGEVRGITLWGVHGVFISGCTFQNNIGSDPFYPHSYKEGTAILSVNANYTLAGFYQGVLYPLELPNENNFTRSSIEGFQYGIEVRNSDELSNVSLSRTDFRSNIVGAYVEHSYYTQLIRNTFEVENGGNELVGDIDAAGAHFSNSSRYKIEGNTFVGVELPKSTAGLIIEGSGKQNNLVYKNSFDYLAYATAIYGTNGVYSNSFEDFHMGLELKCNNYSQANAALQNKFDLYLHTDAVIDRTQGILSNETSDPAGNLFSADPGGGALGNIDIKNPNFSLLNYFHHQEDVTIPIKSDYDLTHPEYTQSSYYQGEPCPSSLDVKLAFKSEKLRLISSLRAELSVLETEYKNILNGGIKPEIMDLLLDDFATSSQVHEKLLLGSPYLSDDVLMAAIDRSTPLSQWDLAQVLTWNGPLSKAVMDVFNAVQPLGPYLESLVLNRSGNSQRSLLELEIKARAEQISAEEAAYVYAALSDPSVLAPYQKIIDLYANETSAEALRCKIAAQVHQKKYAEALDLLNEYQNNFSDNYAAFKLIDLALEEEGLNWFQMSPSQLTTIHQIALQTDVYGAKNAQAILALLEQNPQRGYSMPIATEGEQRSTKPKRNTAGSKRQLISASPNPTTDWVYMSYELPKDYTNAYIIVHNALGQQVDQLDITWNSYISKLNCQSYPSGIYALSLLVDGAVVETIKLSVDK